VALLALKAASTAGKTMAYTRVEFFNQKGDLVAFGGTESNAHLSGGARVDIYVLERQSTPSQFPES
jgi:hypothetical protein